MINSFVLALMACPLAASAAASGRATTLEPAAAPTKLWRLDCGRFNVDSDAFSDSFAYAGRRRDLVGSCYLVKHHGRFLLWDAGLSLSMMKRPLDFHLPLTGTLDISIAEQLLQIGVRPDDIEFLGTSHNHADHVGQANDFLSARLLIGREDFDALKHSPLPFAADAAPLKSWLDGRSPATLLETDYDVFGDGQVTMIRFPGHTPGHYGLLVRLKSGVFLLSGDALHFEAQFRMRGVPPFNADRADTLASMDRLGAIASNLGATLIVQHDAAHVAKLPAFPAAAE